MELIFTVICYVVSFLYSSVVFYLLIQVGLLLFLEHFSGTAVDAHNIVANYLCMCHFFLLYGLLMHSR